MLRVVLLLSALSVPAWGQQATADWWEELRKCGEAQDWTRAMAIVNREVARAPGDMDVRAWRARVLTWSGDLGTAELEFNEILKIESNDPDNWVGLASVYSKQGRSREALKALDRALHLDPNRADIHVARAAALRALGDQREAKREYNQALALNPDDAAGRAGILSLRRDPRHELTASRNTDVFNCAHGNQYQRVAMSRALVRSGV